MASEQQKRRIEAMKNRIRKKAATFGSFLNNPVGQELVNILEEEFYERDDLRGETVEDTYYNLGARDIVVYLRTLQRINDTTSEME